MSPSDTFVVLIVDRERNFKSMTSVGSQNTSKPQALGPFLGERQAPKDLNETRVWRLNRPTTD